MLTLPELLQEMINHNASDLHITVNSPPVLRVDGKLAPLGKEVLTPQDTQNLAYSILTEKNKKQFEEKNELDLSFGLAKLSRFRANVYRQRGSVAVAIRRIPHEIPDINSLGLPPIVAELTTRPNGLILVTGPTGSGKSTTLAALVDKINSERPGHIITIEDPIEFVHSHKRGIVNQRQIGSDTETFGGALRYVLRQDPNVVLIGEMRDLETIETALTVAETGHLVLGTLHTNSSAQTVHRIIDIFPADRQSQVLAQLSLSLEAVISQQLLPRIGSGRVLAIEILICTPAVRSTIRDNKIHQLYSSIQIGQKFGMVTMNQSLHELVSKRMVSRTEALYRSQEPDELLEMLEGRKRQ